jgi:high-affinity Fe2+/Pb2+ permease
VDVVMNFFRAMPDVARAAWDFGDGFYGATITALSVALLVGFLLGAVRLRDTHGWLSATFGAMAVTIAMWWGFGILPSAWMYFVDGARDLLEGVVIPEALPGLDNFYAVFRDSVVMGMMFLGIGILVLIALQVQKRYPRSLVEGEERRPQSGGYK